MTEQARRDLRNVLVMALADGKLTKAERDFIHRLRERLGASKDEFRRLVEDFKANPKKILLPRGGPAADRAIQLMASMAAADGKVSDKEQRVLNKLAKWAQPRDGKPAKPAQPPAPMQAARRIEADPADARRVSRLAEVIYRNFAEWDEQTRAKKVAELAGFAEASLEGLLRILESYRTPEGSDDASGLKTLAAEQLGRLADIRAAYYLAQQVTLGDTDDELTNQPLRSAAAEALGKLVGQDFSRDRAGVEAARQWWGNFGGRRYTSLAI